MGVRVERGAGEEARSHGPEAEVTRRFQEKRHRRLRNMRRLVRDFKPEADDVFSLFFFS